MKTTELFWPVYSAEKQTDFFTSSSVVLPLIAYLLSKHESTPARNHFEKLPVLITIIIFPWKPQNLQD